MWSVFFIPNTDFDWWSPPRCLRIVWKNAISAATAKQPLAQCSYLIMGQLGILEKLCHYIVLEKVKLCRGRKKTSCVVMQSCLDFVEPALGSCGCRCCTMHNCIKVITASAVKHITKQLLLVAPEAGNIDLNHRNKNKTCLIKRHLVGDASNCSEVQQQSKRTTPLTYACCKKSDRCCGCETNKTRKTENDSCVLFHSFARTEWINLLNKLERQKPEKEMTE